MQYTEDKETLIASFSGGETSAYMARWLQLNKSDEFNLVFVFMNTGAEHSKTLDFVNKCDKEWGLNMVWIEAVVHHGKRKSCTHKVVSYETASETYGPFYETVKKYGIPNRSYPHCNRAMKLEPFESWMKENHPGAYRAIGIRVDEIDRMSVKADKMKIKYPLIGMNPTTKEEVKIWWSKQPFNLGLPEHLGNCVTCWKKSDRKLKTIAMEDVTHFAHMQAMELAYSDHGSETQGHAD